MGKYLKGERRTEEGTDGREEWRDLRVGAMPGLFYCDLCTYDMQF